MPAQPPALGLRTVTEVGVHLSKNWFDYTHPSTPCPAEIFITDRRAKFISRYSRPVLTGRRSRKVKLGHYPAAYLLAAGLENGENGRVGFDELPAMKERSGRL